MKLYKIKLDKRDGFHYDEEAGLYDVCKWFIHHYPDDIFVSSNHPVHIMRDRAKQVLALRKRVQR